MTTHAVVLAGGYGTRLRPFTERTPKHLLPIGHEPVIAHQLHRLAAAGVDHAVLATSYRAEQFRPRLGNGAAFGVHLDYARETTPLGTAGALRHALNGIRLTPTDRIVVLNGDLITEHDIGAQLAAHTASGALATLHGRHVDDSSAYGLLHCAGDRIERFEEKPPSGPAGWVNAGTYVISPALLDHIEPDTVVSLERQTFPEATQHPGGLLIYRENALFRDIGTPGALLDANLHWAATQDEDSVILDAHVAVDATVTRSLVMPGAHLGSRAICRDSILGPGAHVGDGAALNRCVIGDDAHIAAGARLSDVTLDVGARHPG